MTLVDVVVRRRLDEERVLALADSVDAFLVGFHQSARLRRAHERPHSLVDRNRRPLAADYNNNNNKQIRKVVTSEALGPGSVLVSRERRESLREEECLKPKLKKLQQSHY